MTGPHYTSALKLRGPGVGVCKTCGKAIRRYDKPVLWWGHIIAQSLATLHMAVPVHPKRKHKR